ncbi:MAG: AAA family ATPase [Deltaproteobacteria bacterium]|nr:AAA family ATPase [Deltaproteobacteria bacterium]
MSTPKNPRAMEELASLVADLFSDVRWALEEARQARDGGKLEASVWRTKQDSLDAAREVLARLRREGWGGEAVMPEPSDDAKRWLASGSRGKKREPAVTMKQLADIEPEPKHWLVKDWIPRRALSLLTGDPGLGKSTLTCELAARVSRGEQLFGEDLGPPANVVLVSLEDDPADTIRPRLDAAGADVSKVWLFELPEDGYSRPPSFPRDLDALALVLERLRPSLVIFDPLSALLGASCDMHRDQDVRGVFAPIAKLAQDFDCAIVFVRHMKKGTEGPALYRGMGSIGLTGASRCELLVARDPRDPKARVVKQLKSNAGPDDLPAKRFRLVPVGDVTKVEWLADGTYSAAELLAEPQRRPGQHRTQPNGSSPSSRTLRTGPAWRKTCSRPDARTGSPSAWCNGLESASVPPSGSSGSGAGSGRCPLNTEKCRLQRDHSDRRSDGRPAKTRRRQRLH